MKVEKLCYFHCFPKHLRENQKRGPCSHMLRVRIFQVEVVMAHVLKPVSSVRSLQGWALAVGSCGHTDYWAQDNGRPEGGLVKESSISRSVILRLPNAVTL